MAATSRFSFVMGRLAMADIKTLREAIGDAIG